jgi:hypothetical protein
LELGAGFLTVLAVDGEKLFGLVVDPDHQRVARRERKPRTDGAAIALASEDAIGWMEAGDTTGAGHEAVLVVAIEGDAGGVGAEIESANADLVGNDGGELGDEGERFADGTGERGGPQVEGVQGDDHLEPIAVGTDDEGEVGIGETEALAATTEAGELEGVSADLEGRGLVATTESAVQLDEANVGHGEAASEGEPVGARLEQERTRRCYRKLGKRRVWWR